MSFGSVADDGPMIQDMSRHARKKSIGLLLASGEPVDHSLLAVDGVMSDRVLAVLAHLTPVPSWFTARNTRCW